MELRELTSRWHSSGIKNGDCVLLHSNVKRLIRELIRAGIKSPIDFILDSFLNAVGDNGTLMIPLFNFDFCSGVPFDVKRTVSQMGALTETARLRCNGLRSGHPVYSFCAFGPYAAEIHAMNNISAYAEDSPLSFLRRVDGKIAALDLEDQGSMTFYHHVEEICGVDYRYSKEFSGDYIDFVGNKFSAIYSIYVRKIEEGVLTYVNPAGESMWVNGISHGDRPGVDSGLRIASAREVFDFVQGVITSGRAEGMLFRYT